MFSGLLQDWITIDGAGTSSFIEARPDWLDLARYADVVFWVEVRAVSNPGAGNVVLTYETAPALDESLFQPLGTVTLVASPTPVITQVKLSTNPAVPLARFARWKLAGTAAGNWSATFRVFTMANKGSAGGFDPAVLPLTGWWRGSFVSSPWSGVASAGAGSASNSLANVAFTAPSVGAALNGYAPAAFNGTTDGLVAADTTAAMFGTTAWSYSCLVYFDTLPANAGAAYLNPTLLTDDQATLGIAVSVDGAEAFHLDAAAANYLTTPAAPVATSAWTLVQARWTGASVQVRVNGGAWQTVASTGQYNVSGTPFVGPNYAQSAFLAGRIMDHLTANSAFDDATFDKLKAYVNARYGLNL